jgi:SAM-dependent methyltransferase
MNSGRRHDALLFSAMVSLGLRADDLVLEIGCGALGLGRLLIPYLLPGHYFGIEAEQSRIEDGVRFELGHDLFSMRQPQFHTTLDAGVREFGVQFDFLVVHRASLEQLACIAREAAARLRPDGVLMAPWTFESTLKLSEMAHIAEDAGLRFRLMGVPHTAGKAWPLFSLPGCRRIPEERPPFDNISSVEVLDHVPAGFVDAAEDTGDSVLMSGWAVDPVDRSPARQVLFAYRDGAILATARPDFERMDIALIHGPRALMSGFRALVPKGVTGCYSWTEAPSRTYLLHGAHLSGKNLQDAN